MIKKFLRIWMTCMELKGDYVTVVNKFLNIINDFSGNVYYVEYIYE